MKAEIISIENGNATFVAIKNAINELRRAAPKDCEVVAFAFNLTVRKIVFYKPNTFLFRGLDNEGNDARIVCHFTQAIVRVAVLPRAAKKRPEIGFHVA